MTVLRRKIWVCTSKHITVVQKSRVIAKSGLIRGPDGLCLRVKLQAPSNCVIPHDVTCKRYRAKLLWWT